MQGLENAALVRCIWSFLGCFPLAHSVLSYSTNKSMSLKKAWKSSSYKRELSFKIEWKRKKKKKEKEKEKEKKKKEKRKKKRKKKKRKKKKKNNNEIE